MTTANNTNTLNGSESSNAKIGNFSKNCMGTTDFDGLFFGMRKPQEFTVYPISKSASVERLVIQSATRFGTIALETGIVCMSKSHANGANSAHLAMEGAPVGKLDAENLLLLKSHVFGTASGEAGTNGAVHCDNSGALEVFNTHN